MDWSLAMFVTFQKFCFISCLWATGTILPFQVAQDLRNLKVQCTTAYCLAMFPMLKPIPCILNISVSFSMAHQSIDISKFNISHFCYIMYIKKSYWIEQNNLFRVGFESVSPVSRVWTAAVLPLTQKTQNPNHYIKSTTGHKKLKKVDNFKNW